MKTLACLAVFFFWFFLTASLYLMSLKCSVIPSKGFYMQISRHVVSSSDLDPKALTITHSDQKGPGGDNHRYCISNFNTMDNYNRQPTPGYEHLPPTRQLDILFQSGNPAEGFNGITLEALLAICEHRLLGCQEGPYKSEENQQALLGVSHALHSLHQRTNRLKTAQAVKQALVDLEAGRISLS